MGKVTTNTPTPTAEKTERQTKGKKKKARTREAEVGREGHVAGHTVQQGKLTYDSL